MAAPEAERDGASLLAAARRIAFPRYPGSAGDRRAIALVGDELCRAGLEVEVQQFSYDLRAALGSLRAALVASSAAIAAAGGVAAASPVAAAALLAAAFLAGGTVVVWAPGIERLYAAAGTTTTSNVAGWRRVRRPRLTLILLAHHDSKSQSPTLAARMALTILALSGALLLALVLGGALLAERAAGPVGVAPVLGAVTAASLLALATLRSGNESPGGVDNAGSVAILLQLARELPAAAGDHVEWVFLSTGAEEDHMIGAMRWLDAHRAGFDNRPVLALNFDGAGAPGKVALLERYGLGRPFSPELSAVARRVARRCGIEVRGITLPPAIGIDAIPFAHRGVPCLTLASGSLGRATISVHSSRDVADHLDPATLERVARLGREMALEIAASRASDPIVAPPCRPGR